MTTRKHGTRTKLVGELGEKYTTVDDCVAVVTSVSKRSDIVTLRDDCVLTVGPEAVKLNADVVERYAIDALMMSERIDPGSFRSHHDLKSSNNAVVKKLSKNVLRQKIEQLANVDSVVSRLFDVSVQMCGRNGSIMTKFGSTDHVELNVGHVMKRSTTAQFIGKEFNEPYIICIDGYLDEVHELEQLLCQLIDAKSSCMLLARSFSENVLKMLNENSRMDIVHCAPIVVDYDLDGMNTLMDVSTIVGSHVVSHLRGDLISAINLNDQRRIRSIKFFHDRTVMMTSGDTRDQIVQHRNSIVQRRSQTDDFRRKLYDDRISLLIDRLIMVSIKDDSRSIMRMTLLDDAYRWYRTCLLSGVVDFGGTYVPASSVINRDKFVGPSVQNLERLAAII